MSEDNSEIKAEKTSNIEDPNVKEPEFLNNFHQGRLHGALARKIGIQILNGTYQSGEILPNEVDASARHEISRSAYREAMRILAAKGLVESKPKMGTRVNVRQRWNLLDPEVLGWMFETEPSLEFINGLFELRLIIEPAAAGLAAQRRSEEQLALMHSSLEIMQKNSLANEEGRKADLVFHDTILEATGNEALVALSTSIGAAVAWTTRFKQRVNALPRDPFPDHMAVFEAIKNRDISLAKWSMETLIRMALNDTHAAMDVQILR